MELREDLDGLLEVTQWPDKAEALHNVDSKTKAAFTRRYNKEGAPLPFAVQTNVTKKAKVAASSQEGDTWGEEEEEAEEEEDGGSDLENDAMIKAKKPAAAKKTGSKGEAGPSKAKGKGPAKGKK